MATLDDDATERTRLDRWLWAARFFKTRSLAADAVTSGRVLLNGERTKPAKALRIGGKLRIRISPFEYEIDVIALSTRRGPAAAAQGLYLESIASREQREALAAQLKALPHETSSHKGRPTKRDRRALARAFGK
jgi:ribosome-associated heat shock protein Hsp15